MEFKLGRLYLIIKELSIQSLIFVNLNKVIPCAIPITKIISVVLNKRLNFAYAKITTVLMITLSSKHVFTITHNCFSIVIW